MDQEPIWGTQQHFWEDWSSDDEETGVSPNMLKERRQYKMLKRINLDKWDDVDFPLRFRVSKRTFMIVLSLIETKLKHIHPRSRYIKPDVQLLIVLRFYALGSMQLSIADFAGVSITSVCRVLRRVSAAIASIAKLIIKMPRTPAERLSACKAFFAIASFPRAIGAIDCTHVRIQSPGGEHSENFRNRKGYFSINVQTIAAADLKILSIAARWPGATHDQTIFNNSFIKYQLETGVFDQFIIVGDSGYQNTKFLATPLLRPANAVEELYNESQIRTRNVVERSYGVLKRRFPVLSLGMRVRIETVQDIIIACATLNNICIDQKEKVPPVNIDGFDDMLAAGNIDVAPLEQLQTRNTVRDELFINYWFVG